MITIAKHLPASLHQSIDRYRHSHIQSLHTTRKLSRTLRLDEKMNMIALY